MLQVRPLPPIRAQNIQRQVGCNARQPTVQPDLVGGRSFLTVETQKDFLRRILSRLVRTEQPPQDPEDPTVMAEEKGFETCPPSPVCGQPPRLSVGEIARE